jgi:hypothetical protein
MTSASVIQKGIGKGRQPWQIRQYLSGLGLSMSDVARRATTFPQVAQETVKGIRNHRRVLAVLEDLGCPAEYLYGNGKERAA